MKVKGKSSKFYINQNGTQKNLNKKHIYYLLDICEFSFNLKTCMLLGYMLLVNLKKI